jgi:hypothetical protein
MMEFYDVLAIPGQKEATNHSRNRSYRYHGIALVTTDHKAGIELLFAFQITLRSAMRFENRLAVHSVDSQQWSDS